MITINSKTELASLINSIKLSNKTIGFIPTMGALHQGHLSLVSESKKQCNISIVSIFVNPTQFNDLSDLEKYPRTLESDLKFLDEIDCDIVFTPENEEMYPKKDNRIFDFGNIDKVMEGAFRPGHFNGVAQIVSKLFDIVKPNCAFFGKKDFQQVAIINNMVKQLNYNIQIISCQIIREKSGLAMSSRNERLSPENRKKASFIYETILEAKKLAKLKTVNDVKTFVENKFTENTDLKLEYFEIVDDFSLQSVKNWADSQNITACIVAHIEGVRLIDNIKIDLK
jgi:pantoate--beta-alanine ligase